MDEDFHLDILPSRHDDVLKIIFFLTKIFLKQMIGNCTMALAYPGKQTLACNLIAVFYRFHYRNKTAIMKYGS
jgi:hypothetical protein